MLRLCAVLIFTAKLDTIKRKHALHPSPCARARAGCFRHQPCCGLRIYSFLSPAVQACAPPMISQTISHSSPQPHVHSSTRSPTCQNIMPCGFGLQCWVEGIAITGALGPRARPCNWLRTHAPRSGASAAVRWLRVWQRSARLQPPCSTLHSAPHAHARQRVPGAASCCVASVLCMVVPHAPASLLC